MRATFLQIPLNSNLLRFPPCTLSDSILQKNSLKCFLLLQIECLQNRNLMKELGVKRMPSVHFYAGELGKVEDLLCGPKKIPILKETLTRYAMYGVGAANHMVNDAVVSTETSHDEVPSYSRSTVVGEENDLLRVENAIAASIREAREALQVANDTHSHSELYSS